MKTKDIEKALAAMGLVMRRTDYVIRSRIVPGWQGRPKGKLDIGYRWNVTDIKTGKPIVSRPTPAAVWKWINENYRQS